MSTTDTARASAWALMTEWSAHCGDDDAIAGCLLELRARVERLEQAQQQPAPSTPAGLVSDVAALIADFASTSRAGDDCTPAASEVLHKVADWLLDKSATISSDLLRREVGR